MSTTSPPPEGPSGPEYLEHGAGDPLPSGSGGRGRRTTLIAGGAVALLAAAGAGTWAAVSFLGGGAQPAEALPADTLAYAAVDLDPSGAQQLEAVRMLNKFPAFEKEVGISAGDDLRRAIFEQAFAECDSVDYAQDVQPWLGSSFAVAAVDAGEDDPSPVAVVEVSDAAGAEEGLAALAKCAGSEDSRFTVAGDWAYLGETDAVVRGVADDVAGGSLADDTAHQEWMGRVGDSGVVSMYASADSGPALGELMTSDLSSAPLPGGLEAGSPDAMAEAFEDFGGGAGVVRFANGGVEVEFAGDLPEDVGLMMPAGEDATLDLVDTLPDDTAVAYGAALPEGWAKAFLDGLARYGMTPEQVEQGLAMVEQQTGLALPEDLETLLGEQFVLALGGGFDLETLMNSADPTGVPLGLKVLGDPQAIEAVVAKLGEASGMPGLFETETSGEEVLWSPSPDYRASLASGGALGDTEAYQKVVAEADRANSVMFVNFDAGDGEGWLSSLAASDAEFRDNVAPLDALGISGWTEDGTSHGVARLTTD